MGGVGGSVTEGTQWREFCKSRFDSGVGRLKLNNLQEGLRRKLVRSTRVGKCFEVKDNKENENIKEVRPPDKTPTLYRCTSVPTFVPTLSKDSEVHFTPQVTLHSPTLPS